MNRVLKYIVLVAGLSRPTAEAKWCLERVLESHRDYISGLIKMSDSVVVSASFDGSVKVFDVEQGICRQTLLDHLPSIGERTSLVHKMAVSDEGTRRGSISLAKYSDDSFLVISERYHQLTQYTLVGDLYQPTTKTDNVSTHLFENSPTRDQVATSGEKCIPFWYMASHPNATVLVDGFDLRAPVTCSYNMVIKGYEFDKNGTPFHVIRMAPQLHGVSTLCVLPGNRVALGFFGSTDIYIIDTKTGSLLRVLSGTVQGISATTSCYDIQIACEGLLATVFANNMILLWDIEGGEVQDSFDLGVRNSNSIWKMVVLSADRILTGGLDGSLKIWKQSA